MTLRQNKHEFLEISYLKLGFLVNRNQFTNSIFVEKEENVKSRVKYLDRIIMFNGERVICFNFDHFLKSLFKFDDQDKAQLALILNTDIFSEKNQELFKKLIGNAKIPLSENQIALKIGNDAKINKIKLDEIKLLTKNISNKLINCGLLGIRIISDNSFQYFIDLERLIFDEIILTYRKER